MTEVVGSPSLTAVPVELSAAIAAARAAATSAEGAAATATAQAEIASGASGGEHATSAAVSAAAAASAATSAAAMQTAASGSAAAAAISEANAAAAEAAAATSSTTATTAATAAQAWASSAGRVLQLQPTSVGWWQIELALIDAGWIGYLSAVMPAPETPVGQVIARGLPVTPGDAAAIWVQSSLTAALGWSGPDATAHMAALFAAAALKNLGAPTAAIDPTAVNVSRAEFQGLVALAVRTDPQTVASAAQAQARANIGAAPSDVALFIALLETVVAALPTSLPSATGHIWNNGGTLCVS